MSAAIEMEYKNELTSPKRIEDMSNVLGGNKPPGQPFKDKAGTQWYVKDSNGTIRKCDVVNWSEPKD